MYVHALFQSHLLGVFDNVNEAEFHATEYDKILAVISQEGEKLQVCNGTPDVMWNR